MRTRDHAKELKIRKNAFKLICKQGFEGFSMGKLARAAGVSPATLYIYYKNKDDLVLQLYQEEMLKLTSITTSGFEPEMSFAEGLRVQWINRTNYYIKHPTESYFLELMRYSPYQEQARKRIDPAYIDAMRSFVKNSIESGELKCIPLEIYWSVAFAPLYQLLKFHQNGHTFHGNEKFVFDEENMNLALDLVVQALKPIGKK